MKSKTPNSASEQTDAAIPGHHPAAGPVQGSVEESNQEDKVTSVDFTVSMKKATL